MTETAQTTESTENACQNCGKPAGDRSRCSTCMGYVTKSNRERRARYRLEGRCPTCGEPTPHKSCDSCLQKQRTKQQISRLECLVAYGGVCSCCGEDHPEFLQIDHADGNGAAERSLAKANGLPQTIYARLKKQGYPPGFRVLCANCNMALAFYGSCPHHPEIQMSVRGRAPTMSTNEEEELAREVMEPT